MTWLPNPFCKHKITPALCRRKKKQKTEISECSGLRMGNSWLPVSALFLPNHLLFSSYPFSKNSKCYLLYKIFLKIKQKGFISLSLSTNAHFFWLTCNIQSSEQSTLLFFFFELYLLRQWSPPLQLIIDYRITQPIVGAMSQQLFLHMANKSDLSQIIWNLQTHGQAMLLASTVVCCNGKILCQSVS